MKPMLLTCALLGSLTAAAQAQTAVMIYGRFNTTAERQTDKDGRTTSVLANNSSRIGFKGVEDLGGGTTATFVLESGFNSDTGAAAATFWGRESTVGIAGPLGALRFGNMPVSAAYFTIPDQVSKHNHDTGSSSDVLYALGYRISSRKMNNTLAYTSPTFGGVRLDAQYGLKETASASRTVLAANYDSGPLHLGAGYESYFGLKSASVRVAYDLGALRLSGYYERNSGADAIFTNARRNNLRIAAMYTLGASELHLNAGRADDVASVAKSAATQVTAGYNYNLSKRTKVYGYYTRVSDGKAALYGGNFKSLALGIRQNF